VSPPDDPVIVLASDLAIIELVDDNNEPVPPGTPSAKALVTNLFNSTQPLIRYELPDRFVRHPDAPDHGHLRVTVEGRADSTLQYGDIRVHPIAIHSTLLTSPQVVEYQVQQTVRGIHVDVIGPGGIDEAALCRSLTFTLVTAGLTDPEVTISTTESIDRNPETGKLRRFIQTP
jgi:phenylacetate-CoA ligase